MLEDTEATSVRFCPTCNKPFTAESTSYTRHVSYCRRTQSRPKVRRKSCRACKAAKAKCSFDTRCSRCSSKGIECVYDRTHVTASSTASTGEINRLRNRRPVHESSGSEENSPTTTPPLPPQDEVTFSNDFGVSNDALIGLMDLDQSTNLNLPFTDDIVDMIPSFPTLAPTTLLDNVPLLPPSWDLTPSWNLNPKSLLPDPIFPPTSSSIGWSNPGFLTRIRVSNALAHRSADTIMDSLYAMPSQMLRRETLPSFIHPHWHLPSLPEPLAVCMHIAQMYASPEPSIRPFLWRTILAEQRRAVSRLVILSDQEVFYETQAGMIYLLMRLVSGTVNADPDWDREMMEIQIALCSRYLDMNNNNFCQFESENPSLTWADWIYAESRRRTSLVWFLITKTIVVQNKSDCPTTDAPWTLPLPAPKTQWEARSEVEWIRELNEGAPALRTFGGLIDAKRKSGRWEEKQLLGAWNARTDGLGGLLNVAVAMV